MTSRRRGLTVLELLIIVIVIVVAAVLLLRWRGAKDSTATAGPAAAVTDSVSSMAPSAASGSVASDLFFIGPVDSVATTGDTVTVRLVTTRESGAPAAGVTVNLSIASGGGNLSTPSAVSRADGEMEVRWMLGAEPGPQVIRAMMDGIESSATTLEITTTARPASSP